MKRKYHLLYGLIAILLLGACKDDDRYSTSIIRNYEFFLNGSSWSLNTGATNRPLFIYGTNGRYVANYTTFYNISLDNGTYRFFATSNPAVLIPDSLLGINLNDLVIQQSPAANVGVQISPVVSYSSPFNETLQFYMVNRTGTLRLRAKDTTADPAYNNVRAIVTVNRTGYKVSDQTYTEARMELTRSKTSNTGGVNYTDDFIVFETKDAQNAINVRFELLNSEGQLVRTIELEETFEVLSNEVTLAEFYLNEE